MSVGAEPFVKISTHPPTDGRRNFGGGDSNFQRFAKTCRRQSTGTQNDESVDDSSVHGAFMPVEQQQGDSKSTGWPDVFVGFRNAYRSEGVARKNMNDKEPYFCPNTQYLAWLLVRVSSSSVSQRPPGNLDEHLFGVLLGVAL